MRILFEPGDMDTVLVLSYFNINREAAGGARRIAALMRSLNTATTLCQPGPAHPGFATMPLPFDLGRRKWMINWGIFNYYLPPNRRTAARAIKIKSPAAIVLCSIWCLPPAQAFDTGPLILDAQNVDALAIAERFGAGHPFTRMVRACERRAIKRADRIFICSPDDAHRMASEYGVDETKISVAPNGVDFDAIERGSKLAIPADINRRLGSAKILFFMGKLDYEPNREALRFIDETLMPELEKTAPGRFKVLVCGGPVPSGAFHPAMLFAGRVPDIHPFIARADLCLAPLRTGSGTRLKILEYLAHRKPVVATAKAVEGLGGEPGRHWIGTECPGFAGEIARLAAAPDICAQLGMEGYRLVRERFDWAKTAEIWRAGIADCIRRKRGGAG